MSNPHRPISSARLIFGVLVAFAILMALAAFVLLA